ncbi:MAG: hypothetical protein JWN04_2996, partial [Myxococcaceae bacterium]|nr:hypothetical protein [Myxococcaceae bacterium]
DSGIRALAFSTPLLTRDAVAELERTLRAERDARPALLDCHALTEVDAAGLAALLELGRAASGLRELALTRLSRTLLLAAIQAGLAERFAIYLTNEAGMRSLSSHETAPCEP